MRYTDRACPSLVGAGNLVKVNRAGLKSAWLLRQVKSNITRFSMSMLPYGPLMHKLCQHKTSNTHFTLGTKLQVTDQIHLRTEE